MYVRENDQKTLLKDGILVNKVKIVNLRKIAFKTVCRMFMLRKNAENRKIAKNR
jgi:hypothetical protein